MRIDTCNEETRNILEEYQKYLMEAVEANIR